MNLFKRIFLTPIDNSNRVEPDFSKKEQKGEITDETEKVSPDATRESEAKKSSKRKKRSGTIRFVISPLKIFITLLFICILIFSFTYLSAWYLGLTWSTILMYVGILGTVFMICMDVQTIYLYMKRRERKDDK